MTALMWQTALLLLGAYFLGAWIACMARRLMSSERSQAANDPLPTPAPVPRPVPVPAYAEPRPIAPAPIAPAAPAVARELSSDAVTRIGRALSGRGDALPRSAAAAPASAAPSEMSLPTPPDRTASGVSTMVEAIRSRTTEPVEAAPAPAAASAAAATLAAAAAAVSRATTPPPGSSSPGVMPAAAGTAGRGSVSAPLAETAGNGDDLTRIRGVDAALRARLNSAGVRRFAEIAAWKPDQVAAIAAALGMPGRIERENWIEQAQILATGGETTFSQRRDRGETATAEPIPDEGEGRTLGYAGASGAVAAASAAAAAAAALAHSRAPVSTPASNVHPLRPAGAQRDNLQRIGGINSEVERLLNVQGVYRYSQLASWSADDVAKFDRLLGSGGRIGRENWIEQAQVLDRGGQTAFSREIDRRMADGSAPRAVPPSLAPARPAEAGAEPSGRSDLGILRSVRSEAYRPGEATAAAKALAYDDLKHIRGVGVLIEKKLNSLGVTRYDQVANWTQQDIERFSDKLDFKGRIERENWVEQARILSTGGQTEFSRRVDRGEVESSKKPD